MALRGRVVLVVGALVGTGCGGMSRTPIDTSSAAIGTSTASMSSAHRAPFVVLEPSRLRSDGLRCKERSIRESSFAPTLEAAMSRVETVSKDARHATAKPIYLGVRACGPYRAVTIGDRYERAKLLYDEGGALVAAFSTSDVVEQKCLVDLDDATVHYGKRVDCTESELVFPTD